MHFVPFRAPDFHVYRDSNQVCYVRFRKFINVLDQVCRIKYPLVFLQNLWQRVLVLAQTLLVFEKLEKRLQVHSVFKCYLQKLAELSCHVVTGARVFAHGLFYQNRIIFNVLDALYDLRAVLLRTLE